jgi:hypothetical protein
VRGPLNVPTRGIGVIAPCLPTKTDKLPSGSQWLHEIKHDGFRIVARKDGQRVRLFSRPGNDLTRRFPLIVETLARLRSRSCIIDGEAVACDDNGVASFNLIRYRRHEDSTFLYAFDLIELTATTYGATRLRSARPRSHLSWPRPAPASGSTNTWEATARPSLPTPASLASKALSRSGRIQPTAPGARPTGSK